jgi:hypothetical protein
VYKRQSLYKPKSPGLIRPSAETAVASWIINAAPPMARLPKCTICQSEANPSMDEYWHIGEITMRFLKTTSLIVNGEKSFDI